MEVILVRRSVNSEKKFKLLSTRGPWRPSPGGPGKPGNPRKPISPCKEESTVNIYEHLQHSNLQSIKQMNFCAE